ncbi:hypothetical protein GCM10009841_04270 [Microlunatus panaciterrae]
MTRSPFVATSPQLPHCRSTVSAHSRLTERPSFSGSARRLLVNHAGWLRSQKEQLSQGGGSDPISAARSGLIRRPRTA